MNGNNEFYMEKLMKKLKAWYNNTRFRTKLLLIFSITSLLPLLIILLISSRLNTRNMTDKVDELMLVNLTQIAERVNLNLEVYTNVLYQIYQDEEITENIKILLEDADAGYAAAYNRINARLKQYNTTESGIRCTSVVCADGTSVVYDFSTDSSIDYLWRDYQDLRMTEPYKAAEGQPGMVITPTMTFKEREGSKQEGSRHYFHIAKRVFDLEDLEAGSIATIIMSVDVNMLNRICNAKETETGINFIMDQDGRCIAYPDEDFSGLKKKDSLSVEEFVSLSGFMENRDIAVNAYVDPVTGWVFYNAYDRKYILRDVAASQRLYIAIGAFAILASAAAILGLVRQINRSVDEVIRGIQKVQGGDMDIRVKVICRDEIGKIAESFNEMTVRVKNLIQEVKRATDRQKNAEIRALEAQINPHFLYNTLDSINWMAIEKEEYEISRMIRNLGIILRYSVDRSNSVVSIRMVEEWLERYISLHQMRFENVFTYQIRVEEEAKEKRIHKLLLQPFVENAILHGLKDKEGGGVLYVDIGLSEDKRMLHIIIEDNGKGMSGELQKQYNDPEKAVVDDEKGIGLHNVFSRLRMYYGEYASWNIKSIEGMGMVVTVKVPAIEQERV